MTGNNMFRKNNRLYYSIALNIIEGLLAGCNFIVLYYVIKMMFENNTSFDDILKATAIVTGIFILRLIIYSIGYTGSQIGGAKVSKNIRLSLGDKLKRIPLGMFTKKQTGFYINAATASVSNYEKILTHKISDIIKYSVLILMVIVFVATIHVFTAIVLFAAFILLIPSMYLSIKMVNIYGNRKNKISAENTSSITEYITGIQTLRAYAMGGKKNKATDKAMKEYSDVCYKYEAVVIPVGVVYYVINWVAMPAIVLFAGIAWQSGVLGVSEFLMLIMLPLFVCKINCTLFIELTAYKNLMISKKHIVKIIDAKEETNSDAEFAPMDNSVAFDHVKFSYVEDEQVLSNVSFKAESGKMTALIGDSGSGKSTIFNLLSKYYNPDSGEIRIGNQAINDVNSEKVLEYISMVDQDIFLFNDSIYNNIRYAKPDASDDEIKSACALANCDSFIDNMDEGYNTLIGENGNKLSGGERQRLSVARAILKDSPIILLDEATASLDIENEMLVKEAILNLLAKDKTVLIIAHTLSVIKNADSILVLKDGNVIESGTHKGLLDLGGKYKSMWDAEQSLN